MKKRRRKQALSCVSSSLHGRFRRPPLRVNVQLVFLSVGNPKSTVDTLPSVALFPPRDLKFRLRVQASFHLVECVVPLQRGVLMFFSVEKWGVILKRGEKIHRLPSL